LSQELSGVYTSRHPAAYPISAYSYIVTQCARAGDRPTCKGNYGNAGVSETLRQWLRYIACDGQVEMANIGYSPLPPNLSQEIANSIARMYGDRAPERLTPANCANPRFHGGGLPLSPPPPPVGNERSGSNKFAAEITLFGFRPLDTSAVDPSTNLANSNCRRYVPTA
jgi:phosphate transport system substrate-binding protein